MRGIKARHLLQAGRGCIHHFMSHRAVDVQVDKAGQIGFPLSIQLSALGVSGEKSGVTKADAQNQPISQPEASLPAQDDEE